MMGLVLLLAAQSAVLQADERPEIAVALLTSGEGAPISLTRLLDTMAPSLDGAGLTVRSMEQVGVDIDRLRSCGALNRLSCWARVVRRAAAASRLRYLLVVSSRTGPRELRLSAIVIDLDDADRIFGDADAARAENALFGAALRVDETVVRRRQTAVRSWFEAVAEGPLRGFLAERGQWRSLGSVKIIGTTPGTQVLLDGRPVGAARAAETTLEQVAPGRRTITLVQSATSSTSYPFELSPGGAARVVVPEVVEISRSTQWMMLGGSAAAIVVGTVLTAVAAARASSVRAGCLHSGSAGCEVRPVSHRFDSTALPSATIDDVEPGGVPLAPVGIGLATAGAGAAVSTALTWDEFEGWIPTVVGVAAGLVGFGVAAIASGTF